jgi:hypothetical protein
MSSRQKQRLKQQLGIHELTAAVNGVKGPGENDESDDNEDENDDEEGDCAVQNINRRSAFAVIENDSDSEEQSSCEELLADDVPNSRQEKAKFQHQQKQKVSKKKTKKPPKKNHQYDDQLESLARCIETAGLNSNEEIPFLECRRNKLFEIDEKNLDVDKVMKKRFGARALAANGDDEHNGVGVGANRRHLRLPSSKKLLFGSPKDDWSKPPSLAGGGYSLVRDDSYPTYYEAGQVPAGSWFRLEWSEEYGRLNNAYRAVQNSGDANQLVVFLSQYPYHLDGLLQLAMVFAKTGQMDRASDLVRRCLFCLEVSFCETFRPTKGEGHRVDPTLQQNSALFTGLFRHIQLTSMLGCPGVAADIAVFLFALCPEGDPMHVLLLLDYFMVCSGRFEQMLAWVGASNDANAEMWRLESVTSMYERTEKLGQGYWSSSVLIGASPFTLASMEGMRSEASGSSSSASSEGASGSSGTLGLWCLPNWWFSLALAAFNEEIRLSRVEASATERTPPRHDLSSAILRCALLKWPFILSVLVGNKKTGIEGKSLNWRSVLTSPFFSCASQR